MNRPALVLASGSPRRSALLAAAGYRFRVEPSDIDDDREPPPGISPVHLVESRALAKAASAANRFPGELVLGADTVIVAEKRAAGSRQQAVDDAALVGKAADRAEAEAILRRLAGEHVVLTALALVHQARGFELVRTAESRVRLTLPDQAGLVRYLEGDLWRGKAGAYGLQDGVLDIRVVSGEPETVIGLPLGLLEEMVGALGA